MQADKLAPSPGPVAEKAAAGSLDPSIPAAPTPIRQRGRAQSPASSAPGSARPVARGAAERNGHGDNVHPSGSGGAVAVPKEDKARSQGLLSPRLLVLAFALLMVVGSVLVPLLLLEDDDIVSDSPAATEAPLPKHESAEEPKAASPMQEPAPPSPPPPSPADLVAHALSDERTRADMLDILAGAPYELGAEAFQGAAAARLPKLAAAAARQHNGTASPGVEAELHEAVLQLSQAGAGPLSTIAQRLQDTLDSHGATAPSGVKAKEMALSAEPLPLQVDEKFTSPGASSGSWLQRKILEAGAWTGLSVYRTRAHAFRSESAAVVLKPGPPTGDCFPVRGNASIAFRVVSRPGPGGAASTTAAAAVSSLVLEQMPRWAAPRPEASPRRFSAYGDFGSAAHASDRKEDTDGHEAPGGAKPYDTFLGAFEYSLASPAAQTFNLFRDNSRLHGLRLVFEGMGWGKEYMCIHRVRLYGQGPYLTQPARASEP